jgi:hypothetical protein
MSRVSDEEQLLVNVILFCPVLLLELIEPLYF